MSKLRKSHRANNPVQWLGKTTPTQFQDIQHSGTQRDNGPGRCYLFDVDSYISVPANSGDIESVSGLDRDGNIIALTANFVTDHYEISAGAGSYAWNIKCWATGITPTNSEKSSYTLLGSGGASNLFTWFEAAEKSGTTAYKAYAGGVNGTLTNAITVPVGDNPNSIHQENQLIYSWANKLGYTLDTSGLNDEIVPMDLAQVLPPFVDANGDPLQFIGHGQDSADFVDSACFEGNNSAYYLLPYTSIRDLAHFRISGYFNWKSVAERLMGRSDGGGSYWFVTSDDANNLKLFVVSQTIEIASLFIASPYTAGTSDEFIFIEATIYGNTIKFKLNDTEVIDTTSITTGLRITGGTVPYWSFFGAADGIRTGLSRGYDIKLEELDGSGNFVQDLDYWTLQEPIKDAGNHISFDKTQTGNDAVLTNGAIANQGSQNESHDLQNNGYTIGNGTNGAPIGHIIPASSINPTLDAAGNVLGVVQDGKSLLKCGGTTGIKAPLSPPMVQADESVSFWFNHTTDPPTQNVIRVADFVSVVNSDKIFADITDSERVKNIRTHKAALVRAQLDTDKRLTNN